MTFEDCLVECLSTPELVKEWNRLTGNHLFTDRAPLTSMIDSACKYDPDIGPFKEFAKFCFEYVWMPMVKSAPTVTGAST